MRPGHRDEEAGDFAGYLLARWAGLVRTAVLLGCPPGLADEVVRRAMSVVRRDWHDLTATGDLDAAVAGELAEAWERRRRASPPWWEGLPASTPVPALRRLDDLPAAEREERVVAWAAGRPDDLLTAAAATVPVGPTPDPDLLAPARRGGVPAAVLAAGSLLGVGLVVWAVWAAVSASRPVPAPPTPAPVAVSTVASRPELNPVPVVWFARGELHLLGAVVDVPDVVSVVGMGPLAVYTDQASQVVAVTEDGERQVLSTTRPGGTLVAGPEEGWVAWVYGPLRRGGSEIVVWDAVSGDEVARHSVDGFARLVALDGGKVYWSDRSGNFSWRVSDGTVEDTSSDQGGRLLDVASQVRAEQVGNRLLLEQPMFSVSFRVPGLGARLASDGDHVLTRTIDLLPGPDYAVYDTRSGDLLDGVSAGGPALAAAFGPDQTVTFVTGPPPGTEGGGELRTCTLERTPVCAVRLRLDPDQQRVVLSGGS